ncbi:helix-turn-helix transcriptional regulator [Alsobacter sp. SYSU M60028]|uniref:Helix-turn-helix transcriptional regulator n=1 Tax=Alsobacter ponti TaxID=2962936 RepID=A0ABT1L7L5_9HYPH|nr:helix-turn-helix transcriptional regulator [Alsobacter ponti]
MSADDCLAALRLVLAALDSSVGDRFEVVLHDFRQPEQSIVAIAGNVTGRKPGGSVTQIGLSILREGDAAKDQYSYITNTPSGRILKSVTVPLRDGRRHVFGALCVNIDVTEFWMLGKSLEGLFGADEKPPRPVTFVDDVGAVIGDVLKEETRMLGRPLADLSREERQHLLGALDARGVFSLQRAIPQVADHLGLSRATLYNDLKRMRAPGKADGAPGDETKRRQDAGQQGDRR